MSSHVLELVTGIVLLLLGRKLFWVFVAVVGFLSGIEFTSQFFPAESRVVVLIVALATGLLGAIVAIFLQHLIVVFAGFLAGGHLVSHFLSSLSSQSNQYYYYYWLFFLLGGIFAGLLALVLLDWALIILSSLVGATLINQALSLGHTTKHTFFRCHSHPGDFGTIATHSRACSSFSIAKFI